MNIWRIVALGLTLTLSAQVPPAMYVPVASSKPGISCPSTTTMLLHFDGINGSTTFTDSGAGPNAPHTVNNGSGTAALSTATVKFGTASLSTHTGGNVAIVTSTADLVLGTSDFTIDFWVMLPSTASFALYSNRASPITTSYLLDSNAGTLALATYGSLIHDSGKAISTGAWHHIAWTRQSSQSRLFVDGVTDGAFTDSNNWSYTGTLYIGYDSLSDLSGGVFFDEFRVTKGTALWTANFTPPASACN